MASQLNILFMALKSRANTKGEYPIYCRLTLNKRSQQFMVGCTVYKDIWDNIKQRAKGKDLSRIYIIP